MDSINLEKIIYHLTIEDLLNVANEVLERDLNEQEINLLEEKIGDYIDWHGAIHSSIIDNIE